MPEEIVFVLFLQLYLGFSYISFGEIFTAYDIQQDINFKHNEVEFVKAVFLYIFLEINFSLLQKNWSYRFP